MTQEFSSSLNPAVLTVLDIWVTLSPGPRGGREEMVAAFDSNSNLAHELGQMLPELLGYFKMFNSMATPSFFPKKLGRASLGGALPDEGR